MTTDIKEMEIADYNIIQNIVASFYRLWRLKLVPVLVAIIGIFAAYIYITISGQEYSYYSSATIYSAVYGSYSETVSGVTIMNTYSGILGSSRVCERAAAEVNIDGVTTSYLQGLVSSGKVTLGGASTEAKKYGYRLVLKTTLDKPDNVVAITNAMANAFSSEINELLGEDIIQVFDRATNSFMSAPMSPKMLMLIVAAIAFILTCVVIFIIEFFSSKVYIVSQCSKDKNAILGILPDNRVKA